MADPLRAEVVRRLMEQRERTRSERVKPEALRSDELSKALKEQAEEIENSLAEMDPHCIPGRRFLLEEARKIYHQAGQ